MVKRKKMKVKVERKAGGNPQINVRIPKDLLEHIQNEIKTIEETQQIAVNAQSIVLASLRDRYQNQTQKTLAAV